MPEGVNESDSTDKPDGVPESVWTASLHGPQITDAGLVHLLGLTSLTRPGAAALIKYGDREFVTKLLSIIKKNQSPQSVPLVIEAIRTVEQRNP